MNAGLKREWDRLTLSIALASSFTRSGGPSYINSAGLITRQDINPDAPLADMITMTCSTGYDINIPGEFWNYRVEIPWHRGSPLGLSGTGHKPTMNQELRLIGVRLYSLLGGQWRLEIDSIEWYVEGSLQQTLDGAVLLSAGVFAPTRIPLFGVPAYMFASSGVDAAPNRPVEGSQLLCVRTVSQDVPEQHQSSSGTATASGGWTLRLPGDTTDYSLPVLIDVLPPPAGAGCPFGLSLAAVGGTHTGNITVSADGEYSLDIVGLGDHPCTVICWDGSESEATIRWWQSDLHYKTRGGGVVALPNLPKEVVKLQDAAADYGALIRRFALPQAVAAASRECADISFSSCPCPEIHYDLTTVEAQRNAAYPLLDQVVQEDASTLEDVFSEPTYAIYGVHATRHDERTFLGRGITPAFCPPRPPEDPPPGLSPEETPSGAGAGADIDCCAPPGATGYFKYESASSDFPGLHHLAGELFEFRHIDPRAEYINRHAHPHLNCYYHFPNDSDEDNWKVYSAKRRSEDYWLPIRQQYLHLDEVSSFDDASSTKRRADIVMAPLLSSHSSPLAAIVGQRTYWWGVCEFALDERAPAASIAVDDQSASRWSATDASLTVQPGGVMLHPSTTTPTLSFELGDLFDPPYLYPQAAKSITVPAFPSNVLSVNIYLEGQGGDRALIATGAGTFTKPSAIDSVYAGTWIQDFLLTSGADVLPGGVSDATFESAQRVHAPELLLGFTATRLVYEFTLASTIDTLIGFPTFVFATTDPTVVRETGQASALLWQDAPGVRYGQIDVYDVETRAYRSIPLYRPPGTVMSITDYIAWRNLLYHAEGVQDDVDADVALWFDDFELGYPDNSREYGAAIDTLAVPRAVSGKVGAQWLVLNALREVIPLACFPQRERDPATLAFVSPVAFDQRAYALDLAPKRYISRAVNLDLQSESELGTLTGTSTLAVPTPWKARQHDAPLTNEEEAYRIIGDHGNPGERQFAQGVPWHGYFGLLGSPPVSPALSLCQARDGAHFRLIAREGNLWLGRAGNDLPKQWSDHELEVPAPDEASIAVDNLTGRLFYALVSGGDAILRVSDDRGNTWSDINLGAASHVAIEVLHDGLLIVLIAGTNSLALKTYDRDLQLVRTVSLGSLTASKVALSGTAPFIYAVYVESGIVKLLFSSDGGATFGAPITIGAANRASIDAQHAGGAVVLYDAPSVKYARIDSSGAIVASGNALSLDDAGYDVAECVVGKGEWRLGVLGSRDGDLIYLTSADLSTWS